MTGQMTPMRVRAHLASGVAFASPWGVALDGLLAGELWEDQKATWRQTGVEYTRAMDRTDPPDFDLPLARCEPEDGPWHWAATSALPENPGRLDVHSWTGRVDARELEQVATALPKTVSSRQGRYRARRMPLLVTPCTSVVWHAVGDVDAVAQILEPIISIGKKHATGEGHVLRWEITAAEDLDEFTAGHLHPDGSLGRPTPDACHARLAPTIDGGRGRAGIRPPYMHPDRQHELHLPALLDR